MVLRGPYRKVADREEWRGRRDRARAGLAHIRRALVLAEAGEDCTLVVHDTVLAVIAYGDALTIKTQGIKNAEDHRALPRALRAALGNRVPQAELRRVSDLLEVKDDAAYGHKHIRLATAQALFAKAESFAAWAEAELGRE